MAKEYSEEELNEQLAGIQRNAEIALKLLVEHYADEKDELGYNEAALKDMEILVGTAFGAHEDFDDRVKLELFSLAACFLGECIVRACDGRWIYYEDEWAIYHDDKNLAFPFSKMQKFCENGKTDSFVTMYKALKYFHDNGIERDDGEMNFRTAETADDIGEILESEYGKKDEKVQDDENTNHCHGDHWDALIGNMSEKYEELISVSVQEAKLGAKARTKCVLDDEEAEERDCCILKYNSDAEFKNPVTVKILTAIDEKNKKNILMSAYPCATKTKTFELKILEIEEWENGIEATITAELPSEKTVIFFDTDYALHKDEYEIGQKYLFDLAGIVYYAEILEQGGADFEFTGQQAIDFKRKLGEEPEYDENGELKPVHFSLDHLVAFMQHSIPDDAEFHSPLLRKPVESEFFGKKIISDLSIIMERDEDDEENITTLPIIVAAENLEGTVTKDNLIRGLLWLHGCMSNGK